MFSFSKIPTLCPSSFFESYSWTKVSIQSLCVFMRLPVTCVCTFIFILIIWILKVNLWITFNCLCFCYLDFTWVFPFYFSESLRNKFGKFLTTLYALNSLNYCWHSCFFIYPLAYPFSFSLQYFGGGLDPGELLSISFSWYCLLSHSFIFIPYHSFSINISFLCLHWFAIVSLWML